MGFLGRVSGMAGVAPGLGCSCQDKSGMAGLGDEVTFGGLTHAQLDAQWAAGVDAFPFAQAQSLRQLADASKAAGNTFGQQAQDNLARWDDYVVGLRQNLAMSPQDYQAQAMQRGAGSRALLGLLSSENINKIASAVPGSGSVGVRPQGYQTQAAGGGPSTGVVLGGLAFLGAIGIYAGIKSRKARAA